MEKKDYTVSLNVRLHRLLGHIQAILMTFGVKRELYVALSAVILTSVIPIYLSFSDMETAWEWVPLAVSGLALVVVGIQIHAQYSHYQKDYYAIPNQYREKILETLTLPPDMLKAGYQILKFHNGVQAEWYVMSPLVNRHLQAQPGITLTCLPRPFAVGQEAAFLLPSILTGMFRQGNRLIFNGALLRQAQELYPGQQSILLQKAHYFDGQCTNEIVYKKFRSVRSLDPVFVGNRLLQTSAGQLLDLGESPCANFIGVSTLAITRDGMLVVGRQGSASMANANRYAPSGSGSVDFADYRRILRAEGPATLEGVLIHAMERELREEMNLFHTDFKLTTRVLGYARLLERGGKPDFFGLTYIHATSHQLRDRSTSFQEKGLQSHYEFLPMDAAASAVSTFRTFCRKHQTDRQLSIQMHILAQILDQL